MSTPLLILRQTQDDRIYNARLYGASICAEPFDYAQDRLVEARNLLPVDFGGRTHKTALHGKESTHGSRVL